MLKGIWGRKIGMTQVFADDTSVVPVTVVDVSGWFIVQIKTEDRDGYNAVKVAYPRKKYQNSSFDALWLKNLKHYFMYVKEVKVDELLDSMKVGSSLEMPLQTNDRVDAVGTTKGAGFAGVMRRHNFGGGPKSHGSNFKRAPGSLGFMCATGKVVKGKKMPGHMGNKRKTVQNLKVIDVRTSDNIVLVKGSMAGKPGSLVYLGKRG